jgi:ABC-2 type transport system ATP-binding protein
MVTVDSPENLRKQLYGRNIVFHLRNLDAGWVELLKRFEFVHKIQTVDGKLVVGLDNPEEQNPLLVRALVEAGAQIQFVGELRHSLEDVYLQLIHQTEGNGIAGGKEAGDGSH